MNVDRKTVWQVVVSVGVVAAFVTALVGISVTYGNGAQLNPDAGLVLLGLIALFIVAMPTFGYILERRFGS